MMTPKELEEKLRMLGALEAFKRNLWHEHQETLTEHVAHCNRIGLHTMPDYVCMAFPPAETPEGREYWWAVANGFGRAEAKKTVNQ